MIKILVIIFSLCQLTGLLIAQTFVNVYSSDPELKYVVERIDILDENTKEVISSFNIKEHNPFKYLKPYLTQISSNHVMYYDFKDSEFTSLTALQPNQQGYNSQKISIDEINRAVLLTKISHPNYNRNPNYWIVSYNLNIYNGEIVKGYLSSLFILNKYGSIYEKFENKNFPFINYAITENGEYFGCSFGGIDDTSDTALLSSQYSIFDLKNDNIIYKEEFLKKFNVAFIHNYQNALVVKVEIEKDDLLIFFDFEKKKKYSKRFNRDLRVGHDKIRNNGIFIQDRFESFENYFTVEDF